MTSLSPSQGTIKNVLGLLQFHDVTLEKGLLSAKRFIEPKSKYGSNKFEIEKLTILWLDHLVITKYDGKLI